MRILLTNDDGYFAEGINALFNALSEKHDVYISAPSSERSACSNAITIHQELKIEKISDKIFSVSGYPADCTNLGLNAGIIPDVDLVISGINHGPNMGDDIHYSGTVAGARTAHIAGKPALAVSLDSYTDFQYLNDAAEFILNFINELDVSKGPTIFYNINYPAYSKKTVKGVKHTFLGDRIYKDAYKNICREGDTITLQLDGTIHSVEKEGSDITETAKGYISITPLHLDSTDYKKLSDLRGI